MNTQEIRAKALELAVTQSVTWEMESAGDVLALANTFQDYIAHGPKPAPVESYAPSVVPDQCAHQTADGRLCERIDGHDGLHVVRQSPEHSSVQHVDHDGDWGPLCICGHHSGAHARIGGCHAVVDGFGEYCTCDAYSKPEAAA